MSAIRTQPASDSPEFCALMMTAMLFKLGGQITLSLVNVAQISRDYPSMRIAQDMASGKITLTLRSENQVYGQEETYDEGNEFS